MANNSCTARGDSSGRMFRRTSSIDRHTGTNTIIRITRMICGYPIRAGLALTAAMGAVFLQLAIPIILGDAVDQTQAVVTARAKTDTLYPLAILLFALSVGRGILTLIQNFYAEAVGHLLARDLRNAIYMKVQTLPFSFHDRTHSGDLITVGMLDLEGVRMFFSTALMRTLILGLLIGLGAAVMLTTEFTLGLLALSFAPFAAWRSTNMHLALRRTWLVLQERLGILSQVMEENLAGSHVVKAFDSSKYELEKFQVASESALTLSHERIRNRVKNTAIMTQAFFISMGLVLYTGGLKVSSGEITLGALATVLTFMITLQMPVRQLGMMINGYARASTCGSRLFALIDQKCEIADELDAPDLKITEGVLKVENVSFSYNENGERHAIANISFEARKGETIGIVGEPGSGKTTLLHLISRFYDPLLGSISIDGQNIRNVSLSSLRRTVAVVQQDSFFFNTSMENNLAYAEPFAKWQSIQGAAVSAKLHDFILSLPHGYETVVGERGVNLSGGQRQRLSIARGFLRTPTVLILDDSMAAIDAGTESHIRKKLNEFGKNCVTLIVSHRLASLMHADQILVLDQGHLIEQGSHEELIKMDGIYTKFYKLQMNIDVSKED